MKGGEREDQPANDPILSFGGPHCLAGSVSYSTSHAHRSAARTARLPLAPVSFCAWHTAAAKTHPLAHGLRLMAQIRFLLCSPGFPPHFPGFRRCGSQQRSSLLPRPGLLRPDLPVIPARRPPRRLTSCSRTYLLRD